MYCSLRGTLLYQVLLLLKETSKRGSNRNTEILNIQNNKQRHQCKTHRQRKHSLMKYYLESFMISCHDECP